MIALIPTQRVSCFVAYMRSKEGEMYELSSKSLKSRQITQNHEFKNPYKQRGLEASLTGGITYAN